jgi:hypothetical protein
MTQPPTKTATAITNSASVSFNRLSIAALPIFQKVEAHHPKHPGIVYLDATVSWVLVTHSS